MTQVVHCLFFFRRTHVQYFNASKQHGQSIETKMRRNPAVINLAITPRIVEVCMEVPGVYESSRSVQTHTGHEEFECVDSSASPSQHRK